jgi:hypothetical protein
LHELQSTPPRASPVEKQLRMFQEGLRMLGLCAVACIGVHDELSIGEMLSEKERIDRHDDDVLAPMHNQRRMVDWPNIAKRSAWGIKPHSRIAANSARVACFDTGASRFSARSFSRSI